MSEFFYVKNCHFLVVKFSVYLNRRVFVMLKQMRKPLIFQQGMWLLIINDRMSILTNMLWHRKNKLISYRGQ